jgi:hypothetical protein
MKLDQEQHRLGRRNRRNVHEKRTVASGVTKIDTDRAT